MRLGFFGANVGGMASRDSAVIARHAEELGYSSLWTAEHAVLPRPRQDRPPLDPDWPIGDPLISLAYLAAATERIELCTGVLILPQHNPVRLAKSLATLDVLSGGRLVVGIGLGYVETEFAALGVPMAGRRGRAREYLAAMAALWGEAPAFDGSFVSFDAVDAYPKPHRPGGPPIIHGGASAPAFEDAARLGDGWYGFGQTPEQVSEIAPTLQRLREEAGRSGDFRISLTPRARLTPELVDAYRAAGVDEVVVTVEADSLDGVRRRLDRNAPSALGVEPA
jgi:probable F420-dependent oxidoreductase